MLSRVALGENHHPSSHWPSTCFRQVRLRGERNMEWVKEGMRSELFCFPYRRLRGMDMESMVGDDVESWNRSYALRLVGYNKVIED